MLDRMRPRARPHEPKREHKRAREYPAYFKLNGMNTSNRNMLKENNFFNVKK